MACILVIAEALEQRQAWRRLLVRAGYAVMAARERREGLHYCQTHVIDLVLLDLPRPLSQETAALRAFRTEAPTVRLLVLVAPDVIDQSDREVLRQLSGVDRIVEHPVEETAVLAAVGALLALP